MSKVETDKILDVMTAAMQKTIASLKNDFTKVRTGKASPQLVDSIMVDYYGSPTALSKVANITTPDARTIQITPWESGLNAAIERSIHAANIGLNPQNDGKLIRIALPALTEERRKETVKVIKKNGEEAKVIIRNHRRDANDQAKALEKAKILSEDDSKRISGVIQKKTDEYVAEIDKLLSQKEKEILTL